MTDKHAIEAAAGAFVKFNADNDWSLSQVQGFQYGQDHVVRDCTLPSDRQEIWRRPVSDTSPEEMRDFIDCYRAQKAMGAAILAYLSDLAEDQASVEAVARALGLAEGADFTVGSLGIEMDQWRAWEPQARAGLAVLLSRAKEQKP